MVAFACGCDSAEEEITLPGGVYQQFGMRVTANGTVLSELPAGAYWGRTLRISGRDVVIEVISDIVDEIGTARARYTIRGQGLTLRIHGSTTPLYKSNEVIEFSRYDVLDAAFRDTLSVGAQRFPFQGPGLRMVRLRPDADDLDRDGNRTEQVSYEDIYSMMVD